MIIDNVVDGGPALRLPAHLSLGQHIIDCLRRNSEDDCVALINGDTGEETRYSQVLRGAVEAAAGLARLGLRRGDTAALCGENRTAFLYAALGAVSCGAAVTTINLMYTEDELKHAFSLSRPRFVFASQIALSIHLGTIQSYPGVEKIIQLDGDTPVDNGVLLFSDIAVAGTDVRSYEPAEVEGHSDTAFILYSSGTTGLPKGVMLTHKNMLYSAASFETETTERETKILLSIVPWYHAYGLMSTIGYLIVKKLLVYFSGGFDPQKYLRTIQDYKVQVLATVPPIVVFLAKAPLVEQYDLSSVEAVWCGAAPLSSDTIQAALKRLPNCKGIYQAYGMTETSLAATKDFDEGTPKVGSGGYPLPGVKVKVVDIESRQKLGPNQNGEVCIKGPIIMKGYIGNEAETKGSYDEEGYLKTGDIGYYDKDGCFFIVDRLKELIKYKGHQVAPAAVESVILQHSGVAECGVVGAPHELAGELPTAFVVPKPGVKLSEKDILDFTKPKLSSHSRLHAVIIVNEIPKNPSGKILRRVLKQQLVQINKSKL